MRGVESRQHIAVRNHRGVSTSAGVKSLKRGVPQSAIVSTISARRMRGMRSVLQRHPRRAPGFEATKSHHVCTHGNGLNDVTAAINPPSTTGERDVDLPDNVLARQARQARGRAACRHGWTNKWRPSQCPAHA